MGALEELRAEGKVRAIGVSNFGPRDLAELTTAGRVESDQLAYSLLWRGIEHELQALCAESGAGILAYSPMAQGMLTGKFTAADDVPAPRARTRHFGSWREHCRHNEPGAEAETFAAIEAVRAVCREAGLRMSRASLAWLLSREGVASVLAGARNAEQARNNAAAADLDLSQDVLDALTRATDPLKERFGSALDMWEEDGKRIR